MNGILKYFLYTSLWMMVSLGMKENLPFSSATLSSLAPSHPAKPINRDELVYLVDSILDLDSVPSSAIEMLTRYSAELEKSKVLKPSGVPASALYEDFNDLAVFTQAPEECLPDLLNFPVISDSLGTFTPPIVGIVTSNYGWRDKRMHKGIDIDLRKGAPVKSAFDGMVRFAKREGGYGNVVIIRHYNGLETVYAHLSKIRVKPGQVITSGQVVGLGGATGHATGAHLHFEVRFKGHALNPSNFISFKENKILYDSLTIRKSKYGIAAFPSNAGIYTIQRGDSWYEIAKRYGLTTRQLSTLNGANKRFYLRVGQNIRIN